ADYSNSGEILQNYYDNKESSQLAIHNLMNPDRAKQPIIDPEQLKRDCPECNDLPTVDIVNGEMSYNVHGLVQLRLEHWNGYGVYDAISDYVSGMGKGFTKGWNNLVDGLSNPAKSFSALANMSTSDGLSFAGSMFLSEGAKYSPVIGTFNDMNLNAQGAQAILQSGDMSDFAVGRGEQLFDRTMDAAAVVAPVAKELQVASKVNQGLLRVSAKVLSKYKFKANSVTITKNSTPIQKAIKHTRYDMQGSTHGTVPTPHTQSYQWNINPRDATKFGTKELPAKYFNWTDIYTLLKH
ncbi:MAG: hypothetical protein Q8M29_14380, partial [Bacteroidota bacterium]|nr:hypothetical protein [Bacteroidota bacterium]